MTGSTALPRDLHPLAWWAWAIGLATAASFTTNPLLLLLIIGVGDGGGHGASVRPARVGRSFRLYVLLAAVHRRDAGASSGSSSAGRRSATCCSTCPRSRCRTGWPGSGCSVR